MATNKQSRIMISTILNKYKCSNSIELKLLNEMKELLKNLGLAEEEIEENPLSHLEIIKELLTNNPLIDINRAICETENIEILENEIQFSYFDPGEWGDDGTDEPELTEDSINHIVKFLKNLLDSNNIEKYKIGVAYDYNRATVYNFIKFY